MDEKAVLAFMVSRLEGVYTQRGLHTGKHTNGSEIDFQNIGGSWTVVYIQGEPNYKKNYVIFIGSYQMIDLLKIWILIFGPVW